jgi:hypothetical protein
VKGQRASKTLRFTETPPSPGAAGRRACGARHDGRREHAFGRARRHAIADRGQRHISGGVPGNLEQVASWRGRGRLLLDHGADPSGCEYGKEESKKKKKEAAPEAAPDDPAGDKKWWKEKEFFGILSGIVALLGTAVPLMARGFESLSLASRRRKELQHIEDLTGLMEKIKKENVLSKSTQDNVCVQIEAEIKAALDQLVKNRAHRERALEARQKALERKERAQSELPLWRRILLLYWPRGIGAWIAHGFAFVYAVAAIAGVQVWVSEGDNDLLIGSLIILLVSWVFAWFARGRWEKAQIIEKSGKS